MTTEPATDDSENNPLSAEFIWDTNRTNLYFKSLLGTGMAHEIEIRPCVRQGPVYPT